MKILIFASLTLTSIAQFTFAQNSATFTSNLYSTIKTDKSIIISPLSIQIAGAILYSGSNGETADELKKGFQLISTKNDTDNNGDIEKDFQMILDQLNNSVQIANKIYIAKNVELKPNFKQIAIEYYRTDVENIDFTQSSNVVAHHINNWIKNVTDNKISNVIKKSSLHPDTRMLLINAVYFNGGWKKPFNKQKTKKRPFRISDNESKEIEIMHTVKELKYKRFTHLEACALELDYNSSDISMIIILPKSRTGLKDLEKKLQKEDLLELSKQMKLRDVVVLLPKFKIEFFTNLHEKFMELGMTKMFSEKADFSKMFETGNMKIDKALHKAFIEVNEEGTTAAAITTIAYAPVMLRSRRRFHADHPFFFALKTKSTILFVGRFQG